jgi:DNA-binding MarR family transcriptional regulator
MKNSKHIDDIISLIFSISRTFRRDIPNKKKICCLSMVQLGTLKFIKENRPLMKDVADFLSVAKPTLTELINEMEKKKIVKRILSKKDKRSTFVSITKKGEDVLKRSLKMKEKEMRSVFGKLSEEEQKSLVKILKKIIKRK